MVLKLWNILKKRGKVSQSLVLRYNYLAFKMMAKMCLIPTVIDETGRMFRQKGRKQLVANHLVNFVWALRVGHLIWATLYSTLFDDQLHPLFRVINYILTTSGALCLLGNFLMFHVYYDCTAVIFNDVALLREMNDQKYGRRVLSLAEYFVASFPVINIFGFAMPCAVYLLLNEMPPVMLFSMWSDFDPNSWSKAVVFVVCLVGDVYTGNFIPCCGNVFVYYVLLFTLTILDVIKLGCQHLEMADDPKGQGQSSGQGVVQENKEQLEILSVASETAEKEEDDDEKVSVEIEGAMKLSREVEAAVKELKLIRVRMQLFNFGISTQIYLSKLMTLMITIGAGFVAIRYSSSHSLLAALMANLSGMSTLAYIALFNDSFKITDLMEEYKEQVLVSSQQLPQFQRKYVKKVIRSLPKVGVQCGSFNLMEKDSTLTFLDFSSQQIVDLLLTFH